MRLAATSAGFLMAATLGLSYGASAPAVKALGAADAQPTYRLKLGPFVTPPARTVGLIVKTRINGGPPLRLLLDSGANYIVLERRAAVKSGCVGGADLDLIAAGAAPATAVKQLKADSVTIGDLTLRNVPVLVTGHALGQGIHGVIPLSLFAGFLIRLDIPDKSLDLLPYPPERADTTGSLKALTSNRLLFVKGTINETREGYLLLDTGASYTAISRNVARQLNLPEAFAPKVPLQGGIAELDAPVLHNSVRLRVGTQEFTTPAVVAVDLSTTSRYHNLEVTGLIGYPALAGSVLLVNYRDGSVRIDAR
jgi:predicted aspartyl protease